MCETDTPQELPPSGCVFWWYSLLVKLHRPQPEAWGELKKQGWYWYYNKAEGRQGYILANDDYETQPLEFESFDEFTFYREKFAEKELGSR